jgi:hypothetical protein
LSASYGNLLKQKTHFDKLRIDCTYKKQVIKEQVYYCSFCFSELFTIIIIANKKKTCFSCAKSNKSKKIIKIVLQNRLEYLDKILKKFKYNHE